MRRLPLLVLFLALCVPASPCRAEDDGVARARTLIGEGKDLTEIGTDIGDTTKVREGLAKLRAARALLTQELGRQDLDDTTRTRLSAWLLDAESRIAWYADALGSLDKEAGRDAPPPEVAAPSRQDGESVASWCRRVRKTYESTEDPRGRAALARALGVDGGVNALPTLKQLFESEEVPAAREGVHEALAHIGTSRVASAMMAYARRSKEELWDPALDVVYRCLEKPEASEPERPFLRAVRAFHALQVRTLSLEILRRLDAMGVEGVAALGEIVYVEDFGYHTHTIELLSTKLDGRAVPPLVHLMNRFQFDEGAKVPAHAALVKIGWYAVPELIERLDDKAAGIWISYTLRKISGQTMGTDKRKWHDWWKAEHLRHPELFPDPAERPDGGAPPPVVTGK